MSVRQITRNPIAVNPSPPSSGEPTMASTGPRIAPTTIITGDYTLAANQSISGYQISGALYLNGANCTATDCAIGGGINVNQRPGGNYGNPPVSGQKVSYCSAAGMSSVGTNGCEIDHCQIVAKSPGTAIAFGNAGNVASGINMHDSYVSAPVSIGSGSGYHLEAMHLEGLVNSTFTNVSFNYNPPDAATAGETTAALNCSTDLGAPHGNVFDGIWVRGGGPFQAYFYMGSGVIIKNSHFYSYYTYPGGTHKTPSVYSKSNFVAGGTSMTNWVDPTTSTVFNNFADDVPWNLLAAILA